MSLSSAAMEHGLVVKNSFIDVPTVLEVPKFVKLNIAPATCQVLTTTADLLENDAHDEPFERLRLLNIDEVGNADVCSCGDGSPRFSDDVEVASIGSTNVPSDISSTVNVCGSPDSDPNGFCPPSCGYVPRHDFSTINPCSQPMGIQPWVSYQGLVAGGERGDGTSLMFKNLPESLTRYQLEELLNAEGFATRFNFLYLPADLKTGVNFGYAFVNMVTLSDVRSFMEHFQGFHRWPVRGSNKIAEVRLNEQMQGISALIQRYRNSPMMHPSVPFDMRPAIYCNGYEMPFPVPTAPMSAPRTKNRNRARR